MCVFTPGRLFGPMLATVLSLPLSGQTIFEPLNGPPGLAAPFSLAADEAGGVFIHYNETLRRTADGGLTWLPASTGLPAGPVRLINDQTGAAYAISNASGLPFYRFSPNADTWDPVTLGSGGDNSLLTFDNTGALWRTDSDGTIFRSNDGGQTFVVVVPGNLTQGVPDRIVAYGGTRGLLAIGSTLYYFNDSGALQPVAALSFGQFEALAYDPYTGTAYYSSHVDHKVRRSTDFGQTWSDIAFPQASPYVDAYQLLFPAADLVFALTSYGLYRSNNAGVSWELVNPAADYITQMAITTDGTWVLGGECYAPPLRRSTDQGATFTDIWQSFDASYTYLLQQDPGGSLYALSCEGQAYVRSTDLGITWSPFTLQDTAERKINSLAVLPDGRLLALCHDNSQLYRGADGGATWDLLPGPANIWLGSYPRIEADAWGNVYLIGEFQIARSADAGNTWQMLGISLLGFGSSNNGPFARYLPNGDFCFRSGIMPWYYSAADDAAVVLKLADDPSPNPLMLQTTPAGDVFIVEAIASTPAKLYRLTPTPPGFEAVAFPGNSPPRFLTSNTVGHLFAAANEGVFRSYDAGTSWELYGDLPIPIDRITGLYVGADQYLYLAAVGYPAYRSLEPSAYANYVLGAAWLDLDGDCTQQLSAEPGRPATVIKATGSLEYVAYTRSDGHFTLTLPDGTFSVNAVPPNALFEPCGPPVSVTIDGPADTVTLPLSLQHAMQCPYLRVDLGTPLLRRCFENTYSIQYCNDGTATAPAATITVTLDPWLALQGSSLPVASQDGQVYTFDVGDLAPGQCGAFQLTVLVSCDAGLGQMHCTSVQIEPDTLCLPTLEDHSRAIDCQPNIGAYDPNDKRAFVDGVQTTGTVPPGEPVEYVIRFQNTGTDTAFTVVVEDRLALLFDPATVQVLAASHAYTLELHNSRTLRFIFNNIMLPDSNVNEPASHGFVKFRVRPAADLPLGTELRNFADIFFDFNDPVRTNTAALTVAWPVSTHEPGAAGHVTAFPNPFGESVTFVVEGAVGPGDMTLVLADALGRTVRRHTVREAPFTVRRAGLPAGVYYFVLWGPAGRLGAGKVMVLEESRY